MPNISSLHTGLLAMNAQRRVMDTIGHNIANESTPGYHRQRVDLQAVAASGAAAVFAGRGDGPYGVQVGGQSRSYDQLVAARAVREEAGRSAASLTSQSFTRIEGLFPEPSDVGLANQFAEFWAGWGDLAASPGGLAARTQLLERAATLVASIRRTAEDLNAVRTQSIDRVMTTVIDANDLAQQIASLNASIAANPTAAFDLLDRRDLLVTSLAQLTGADARPAPGGQVDLYVGGRAIVSGALAHPLIVDNGQLEWELDGQPATPASGELAALTATIFDTVPRYTAALDDVTAVLVQRVNDLHTTGYAEDGVTTGLTFFTGTTAASLAISADVAGQPEQIAAAVDPASPLDGDLARQLAALAEATDGPDAEYRALIGALAVETRAVVRRADIQVQIADAAQRDADSVGAVSVDEEMVALVGSQRAFEAAARFLTVVDELLGTLIERTGVVGR